MKRVALSVGFLLCVGLQPPAEARGAKRYLHKESAVDMSGQKNIFLGWVDLVPEDWSVHGYSDEGEWISVINRLNNAFQRLAQTKWLVGHVVTGAKSSKDTNAAGQDLYIKFSDVRVDYDNYLVHLSIHFIDPKRNTEIAAIPLRPYYGSDWGFERYLKAALDEVSLKLQVEVRGSTTEK